jgi:hypothetical protein
MSAMTLVSIDGKRTHNVTDALQSRVLRECVKGKVQREITCTITGQVLDVRTVVAILDPSADHVVMILSPDGWRQAGHRMDCKRFNDYLLWHRPL